MSKIKVLREDVINKIAAGEVVERPASVVKELVENSIDAGSSRIEVKVKDGGKDLIQVIDDGEGMSTADARLAFERHATSKVERANDLFSLRTLGFRGEALPSIAAVSRVKLVTRRDDALSGTRLRLVGGELEREESCGCRKGTNIIIKDLFFNTPVRYKYLKQTSTEIGHISDILNRLALAYPQICFKLVHNKRELLKTAGNGNLLDVIFNIYGKKVAKKMIKIDYEDNYMSLTGFVSRPEVTRSSVRYQSFFVNGRFIKSGLMSKAVHEAYHTLLTINRYPIVVLQLKLNPILVDVNVHPTKLEAKFSRGDMVYKVVKEGVLAGLKDSNLVADLKINSRDKVEKREDFNQEEIEFKKKRSKTFNDNKQDNKGSSKKYYPNKFNKRAESKEIRAEKIERLFGMNNEDNDEVKEDYVKYNEEGKKNDLDLIPIGQIHQSYIVAQGLDGMYIIDQHAAHERIIYEELLVKFKEDKVSIQELLVPLQLDLTHQEREVLRENKEEFKRLGFIIEEFGSNDYIVRGVPVGLYKQDDEGLILDCINGLLDYDDVDTGQKLVEERLITISCKSAIKAGDRLSIKEMNRLLEDINRYEVTNCPHGRPVMMHLSKKELEKNFKRR